MKEFLEPAFQPIVDLRTGDVEYYETLARIRDDQTDSGHVTLIHLAERYRFIHLLDLAMLELASDAAIRHGRRIGTNVSALTIEAHLPQVMARLVALGSVRQGLVLEITETVPVHDARKVAFFIAAARELGCRIAIDDFGIDGGHFTAALVRFLQPDFLKLDGSVLARAVQSGDHRPLKQATALAHSVGVPVIAEFVDSAEKIELLALIGIRFGQGCFLGQAVRNVFTQGAVASAESLIN